MDSRLLHFMKQDMKHRIYIFALSCLISFFAYPVVTVNLLASRAFDDELAGVDLAGRLVTDYAEIYDNSVIVFFLIALGFIAALNGFGFLVKSNRADFIHSLPVSREMVFSAVNFDNYIMIFTPVFVMGFICALMVTGRCADIAPLIRFFSDFLRNVVKFSFCYAITVFAVMMTGTRFAAIALYVIICNYVPAVIVICHGMFEFFFNTYYMDRDIWEEMIIVKTSPFWYSVFQEQKGVGEFILLLVTFVLGSVVFFIVSYRLYMKRQLELAGRAMVFSKTEAPIRIMLVIPAGLGSAMMGNAVFGHNLVGWPVFLLVCAVLIGHCVIEIVYNADFRKLFSHPIQLVASLAVALFIYLSFCFDIFGYDTYMPAYDKVKHAGVFCELLDHNVKEINTKEKYTKDREYYPWETVDFSETEAIDRMELTDEGLIMAIATNGIENAKRKRKKLTEKDSDRYLVDVSVSWHMKDGRKIRRKYSVDFAQTKEYLEKLYDDGAYKAAVYPVLSMKEEDLTGVNYEDAVGVRRLDRADHEDLADLLRIYQAEFGSMTCERRRKEDPIFCLKFKDMEDRMLADYMRENSRSYGYTLENCGYYPVYPTFVGTLNAMKKCGADLDRATKGENYNNMRIEFGANDALSVDSIGEIQQILDAAVPELKYKDDFSSKYQRMNIRGSIFIEGEPIPYGEDSYDPELGYHKDEDYQASVRLTFRSREIPGFVMRYFHLNELAVYNDSAGWDTIGRRTGNNTDIYMDLY